MGLPHGHQRERPRQAVAQLQVVRHAQAVVDRRDDVRRASPGCGSGLRADLVAGAVDVAALDAAAGQHQRVAEVPVVAAGRRGR